jgi:hypothetical protein
MGEKMVGINLIIISPILLFRRNKKSSYTFTSRYDIAIMNGWLDVSNLSIASPFRLTPSWCSGRFL